MMLRMLSGNQFSHQNNDTAVILKIVMDLTFCEQNSHMSSPLSLQRITQCYFKMTQEDIKQQKQDLQHYLLDLGDPPSTPYRQKHQYNMCSPQNMHYTG
jgi:hypothetical protein